MAVKIKSKKELETYLNGSKPVVIDFYATWCGPCKMMMPNFEALSSKREDLEMVKVEVDSMMEVAEEFKVMSIPTIVVLKDNSEKSRSTGYKSEADLDRFINESLSK